MRLVVPLCHVGMGLILMLCITMPSATGEPKSAQALGPKVGQTGMSISDYFNLDEAIALRRSALDEYDARRPITAQDVDPSSFERTTGSVNFADVVDTGPRYYRPKQENLVPRETGKLFTSYGEEVGTVETVPGADEKTVLIRDQKGKPEYIAEKDPDSSTYRRYKLTGPDVMRDRKYIGESQHGAIDGKQLDIENRNEDGTTDYLTFESY